MHVAVRWPYEDYAADAQTTSYGFLRLTCRLSNDVSHYRTLNCHIYILHFKYIQAGDGGFTVKHTIGYPVCIENQQYCQVFTSWC
jgi:hypothetical protein